MKFMTLAQVNKAMNIIDMIENQDATELCASICWMSLSSGNLFHLHRLTQLTKIGGFKTEAKKWIAAFEAASGVSIDTEGKLPPLTKAKIKSIKTVVNDAAEESQFSVLLTELKVKTKEEEKEKKTRRKKPQSSKAISINVDASTESDVVDAEVISITPEQDAELDKHALELESLISVARKIKDEAFISELALLVARYK